MPAITLDQLLESRDRRAARQRELLAARPDRCLLSLTVQIPGAVKRNALSLAIARAGVEAVREAFSPEWEELRDLETGYEAYYLLAGDPLEIKRRACRIEDTHPLGRLFDLDVIATPGTPLSRTDIGLAPRRCLLCGNEVRYCMRARTHTQEELLDKIGKMVKDYGV